MITRYALQVLTGSSGLAYATDEHSANPRIWEAKTFDTYSAALDFRKKSGWGDQIYHATPVQITYAVTDDVKEM